MAEAAQKPDLAKLLQAARRAIAEAVPASFEYEGQTYFLRLQIVLSKLEVFDTPATSSPLVSALHGSSDQHGHAPAH